MDGGQWIGLDSIVLCVPSSVGRSVIPYRGAHQHHHLGSSDNHLRMFMYTNAMPGSTSNDSILRGLSSSIPNGRHPFCRWGLEWEGTWHKEVNDKS